MYVARRRVAMGVMRRVMCVGRRSQDHPRSRPKAGVILDSSVTRRFSPPMRAFGGSVPRDIGLSGVRGVFCKVQVLRGVGGDDDGRGIDWVVSEGGAKVRVSLICAACCQLPADRKGGINFFPLPPSESDSDGLTIRAANFTANCKASPCPTSSRGSSRAQGA